MKKISTLYVRDRNTNLVTQEITPGCEWVLAGEGVATRKYDGTACLIRDGSLYKRYDCKAGRTPPANWEAAQDPDPVSGHWPGWMPVGDGKDDRWFREAWRSEGPCVLDGTYELCGPKIQGNPEGFTAHCLIPHGKKLLPDCPRDFEGLREYLRVRDIEGIVWHHPDGRMVKLKAKDFGLKRQRKEIDP